MRLEVVGRSDSWTPRGTSQVSAEDIQILKKLIKEEPQSIYPYKEPDNSRVVFWRELAVKLASPNVTPTEVVDYIKELEELFIKELGDFPNGL